MTGTGKLYFEKQKEAKPCPFCGGEEIVLEEYESEAGNRFRIWCTGCLACIDPGWAQERYVVLKMWNRRVGDEQC